MSSESVLCIGLDAACFEQIHQLINDKNLPNLENLLNNGATSPILTTTPPWTPSAWPSITTGTTPWTHGIYDFYDHTTKESHLVSAKDLCVPYLWEYLSQSGHESIIINVPVTHPVHQMSGSLVPGYIAPENSKSLVKGQPSDLSDILNEYRIYANKETEREAKIRENERLIDSRVTAAKMLSDRHDWSFMMVQFQRTDSIFHTMGHDNEAVRRIYSRVDDAIGSLLDLADNKTTVIVVSDHGIHEYEHSFRCNTWLRNKNWLQTSNKTDRHSWGETTKPNNETTRVTTTPAHRIFSAILTVSQRVGITPERAERTLSIVGLADPIRHIVPDALLFDAAKHVDWSDSQAYCRSVSSLGIRCNVEGRDPDGIVPQSEFPTLRQELIAALSEIKNPEGKLVFDEVYDRHDRHGSDVANEASAPDIVLRPAEMKWKITDIIREPVFDTTNEFSHHYNGMFVAAGPDIRPDAEIDPHVIDVAPLILELLGYCPAARMEGKTPSGLLADTAKCDLMECPEPDDRNYLIDDEIGSSETVTDRLEHLGYLE